MRDSEDPSTAAPNAFAPDFLRRFEADVLSGKLPAHIKKLTTLPDAWQPR